MASYSGHLLRFWVPLCIQYTDVPDQWWLQGDPHCSLACSVEINAWNFTSSPLTNKNEMQMWQGLTLYFTSSALDIKYEINTIDLPLNLFLKCISFLWREVTIYYLNFQLKIFLTRDEQHAYNEIYFLDCNKYYLNNILRSIFLSTHSERMQIRPERHTESQCNMRLAK
jgi:hypothetical protein